MKVIICFSFFHRIVKNDFDDWKYSEVERFVSELKDLEFIRHKSKYYPTSRIKWVKIKT